MAHGRSLEEGGARRLPIPPAGPTRVRPTIQATDGPVPVVIHEISNSISITVSLTKASNNSKNAVGA
jgi:hypothetical protein